MVGSYGMVISPSRFNLIGVGAIAPEFVILSRSEGSLLLEEEILHFACGLVQDDNQ
jgi:hypothetical protein